MTSQTSSTDITVKIKNIFDDNEVEDLVRFMDKRKCLNACNMYLIYVFHLLQSAGILTTTIAAGYEIKALVWVGIGLNFLASLVNIFEQTNNTISSKLLKEIQKIKDGKYVDEGIIVDPEVEKPATNKIQQPQQAPPQ